MRTKRTFNNFKKAVTNESKRYPFLRKCNGRFNENFLKKSFEAGQSASECCNSMTESI